MVHKRDIRPGVPDRVKGLVPPKIFGDLRMTAADQARTMALTMFVAGFYQNWGRFSDKQVKSVVDEVSQISQRAPLFFGQKQYSSGEFAGLLKNMKLKHITVDASNNFKIDLSMDTMYSPLHLMAFMYYALDRLSGGQLSNKAGFEWVKMARMLG